MADKPVPTPENADEVTPEMLLNDMKKSSVIPGSFVSIVFHVLLIGLTSVAFISNGFRETPVAKPTDKTATTGTDATKPEGDATKAGTDAAKAEGDATKAGTDATKPEGDATKAGTDATKPEGDATKAGTDATKPDADLPGNVNKDSKLLKTINDVAPKDQILREPSKDHKINLDVDDDALLRGEPLKATPAAGDKKDEGVKREDVKDNED